MNDKSINFDYVTRDYSAFKESMLNQLSVKMPEYTDRSESDAGIVLIELLASGLDILSYYIDSLARESFFVTAEQRRNVLKGSSFLGYTPKNSSPAYFKQVFELNAVKDEAYTIPAGTLLNTKISAAEAPIYFETVNDLVIPIGKTGIEKDDNENYLYTVDVVEGQSVYNEVIGSSNSTINQSFILKYASVIFNSISVYVNEGNGFEIWDRVNDFTDSENDSKHYTVFIDEFNYAHITFGDGVFGKIPSNYLNGIMCTYRIGGGSYGNVSSNKIVELNTPLADIKSTFNPSSAFIVGEDSESIASIKTNAILSLRNKWGALTLEDFSDIVESEFPQVLSAESVQSPANTDITIYILTKTAEEFDNTLQQNIQDLFDPNIGGRKIIGSGDISVSAPTFQSLSFGVKAFLYSGYSQSEVLNNIKTYLTSYFARGNILFKQDIYLNDLALEIEKNVAGVKALSLSVTAGVSDLTSLVLTPDSGKIFSYNTVSTSSLTGGIV